MEYKRDQLAGFEKIADIFINENREIYAELLRDDKGQKIYFREWFSSAGGGDSFNYRIVNSIDEFKIELKKDVDHGDLAPGRVNKICDTILGVWEDK